MKVRYGRRGRTELLVRLSASGEEETLRRARLLYNNPPQGYTGERYCVAKMRGNRRGTRHEGTVVLFRVNGSDNPTLSPEEYIDLYALYGQG